MYVKMENGKKISVYNGKIWGANISQYAMEHKNLDYKSMIDAMTYNEFFDCGNVFNVVDDWECITGNDYDDETGEYYEIFCYYLVSARAVENLQKYTDEIVFYSEKLDLYVFGVTHWGTSWDYVLTGYEIVGE
ncbi:hypothetical protein SELR_pSRC300440 (plasmid) [Selenomonas ruminantium subsp. lactilytica TAM6421]|uniref:Uncharacterized protein n=1 Tax=Selenomonas ruminantium subsp. lactilytica (strain NBRC 103574 / TAM6421) TaxID=927704 RepID=I0GWI0_SELRL|nr:hypothetical protein [Selenomonas ruminantium]BAL85117.1 hypothetical protein SELR_pSRC300440 [Selenomonas ruminantium subsp. lactilytica TAM6421]